MRRITSIVMTIKFDDAEEVQVLMTDEGIQRWGNERAVIADTIDPTEVMYEALQMSRLEVFA